jgi:tetratricopeptide (TPR) repeat protein
MSRLVTVWIALLAIGVSAALADARKDCFEKSGDIAIRACTEALRRDPKDTVSYVNRAFEYVQKGQHAQSIADYSKAIELDAGRLDAYQGRAWAYLKTGKAEQGLADAERALQLKPNDARTFDMRGHIYEALGRRDDAVADFRRALALEPRMQGSRDGLQRLGVKP